MKQEKTCNATGKCKHKRELDVNEAGYPDCTYQDFCDYQLPRDSRGQEVRVVRPDSQTACNCVPVRADRTVLSVVVDCPIHGAKK